MRALAQVGVFVFAGSMLVASSSSAQQSVYAPHVEAQPIPQAFEPHFPVRLAAADEPIGPIDGPAPLRLSPRSESESGKLDKPLAPSASGAISTVVGSLAIVLGLFVVLAWFSRRLTPAGAAQLPKEVLELLGRALAQLASTSAARAARQQATPRGLDRGRN